MTKKIIGVDQANRDWCLKGASRRLDSGMAYSVVTVMILAATVAIILSISTLVARAESVTGATTDNLLSDEMAEYIVLYGHDADFDEGDMN